MTRLAVELSFELFRRIFPVRAASPSEPPLSVEERRRYRRWELGAIVPLFVICFPVGYLWYLALRGAAGLIRRETPDTRFLLSVHPAIWALPAYEYTRVRGIEHRATFQAPNGNIIRRPHFVIVFDDGTSWSSDGPHESTPETASRIAQLVSRRSGRAIAELP